MGRERERGGRKGKRERGEEGDRGGGREGRKERGREGEMVGGRGGEGRVRALNLVFTGDMFLPRATI